MIPAVSKQIYNDTRKMYFGCCSAEVSLAIELMELIPNIPAL